jgi:LmbE family N-acetylglucosaminyl deacetylase
LKWPERIRWSHVRRLYETIEPVLKASPLKLTKPDRGRVLVLAPHIDDDVIGAGGCLRHHVLAGDTVTAVYFADCTSTRKQEAKEAADVIGFRQLVFFEYQSKTLLTHRELFDRLSALVADYQPTIVYVPSLLDRHNDHLAVNHYVSLLYKKFRYDFSVYGYEIWTALVPNLIVDISDVVEKKKEAIAHHKSQLVHKNWVDAAISLNRYRGVTSGVGMYAEGFIRYSLRQYAALWEKVYGR